MVLAAVVLVLVAIEYLSPVGIGDGHKTVRIPVQLTDAVVGTPIPNAMLQVFDTSFEDSPAGAQRFALAQTDPSGRAELPLECAVILRQTPFRVRDCIAFSRRYRLRIEHEGYQPVDRALTDWVKTPLVAPATICIDLGMQRR